MDHHMDAGTYTLGVEYGRKLLEIDPLSETAHRKLMRLHAFAGRRSRAIADYKALERLLADELDVEPLEETRALYEAIVAEEIPGAAVRELAEPVGPLVPLAGRSAALDLLGESWAAVRGGAGRLTLVTGEPGIGKTRLVKTFLHRATSESAALVLQGRGQERVPPVAYASLAQALERRRDPRDGGRGDPPGAARAGAAPDPRSAGAGPRRAETGRREPPRPAPGIGGARRRRRRRPGGAHPRSRRRARGR